MNAINILEYQRLDSLVREVYSRPGLPDKTAYMHLLGAFNTVLQCEGSWLRPADSNGLPGGIVTLRQDLDTLIVPDLHARMDFILNLLLQYDREGQSFLGRLQSGRLQMVFVGDAFHSELRGARRWVRIYREYQDCFSRHENADQEMRECLGVMEMVILLKTAFPSQVHFLKGNHENIANELGGGNFPFCKYARESEITSVFMHRQYGEDFVRLFSAVEKNLPLLAVGRNFLVSHSEPRVFYEADTVRDYRSNPVVVQGLTWTANNAARPGSVELMLEYYLPGQENSAIFYFGGHRTVKGSYAQRAAGAYVQIHNPSRFNLVLLKKDREIDLDEDIYSLPDMTASLTGSGLSTRV